MRWAGLRLQDCFRFDRYGRGASLAMASPGVWPSDLVARCVHDIQETP